MTRGPALRISKQPLGIPELLSFLFLMLSSQAIVGSSLFGGALYLFGQAAVLFFTSFPDAARQLFPGRFRQVSAMILVFLMAVLLTLVLIIPRQIESERTWMVFAFVLALLISELLSQRLIGRRQHADSRHRLRIHILLAVLHVTGTIVIAWILFLNLDRETALSLFWGYAACDLISLWVSFRRQRAVSKDRLGEQGSASLQELHDILRGTNSFHVYETLAALIIMAVEMSMVLCFSFSILAAEDRLVTLAITAAVILLFYEGAELLLVYRERRHGHIPDPTYVLLFGLILWLYGITSFRGLMLGGTLGRAAWLYLGFCAAGCALCLSALNWLERVMQSVARFAAEGQSAGYDAMRTRSTEIAALLGQAASLAVLIVMAFLESRNPVSLTAQPLLLLPALALVVAAMVFTFRFPLSSRVIEKLERLLDLRDKGDENKALAEQMDRFVIQKTRQPFATSLLRAVLRRFYRHTLIGVEHIHPDESNPIVFLCNHSEFYGPIVAMANIPVPVRPWSIAQITFSHEEVTKYIYDNTFSKIRWIPRPLRHPIARLAAHVLRGTIRQLEGIPVYRDQPGALVKTFRNSVDALLTGDNLVIFPENPNADPTSPGYETNGIGSFFSGFAMLGKIYYQRSGNRCRFVPMYAGKHSRTIHFGEEIVYDPERDNAEEMARIAGKAEAWMREMWAAEKQDAERDS